MSIQSCPFFRGCGFQVSQLIDKYHPFPSSQVKESFSQVGPRAINMIPSFSYAPVDNSWHLFSSRPAAGPAVVITIPKNETREEREAREAHEKQKEEDSRNRLVMGIAVVVATVGSYFFGTHCQQYFEADYKLKELKRESREILEAIPNPSLYDSDADRVCKAAVRGVFNSYSDFYEAKIFKLRVYTGVLGALALEGVALAISAFYKSFRLRDTLTVASFLTVILGVVSYALLSGSDSQEKWEKKNLDLSSTIDQIKQAIQEALPPPPSYLRVEENTYLQTHGYSLIQVEGPYEWTQHMETGQWFWRNAAVHGRPASDWHPGNRQ